MSPWQAAVSPWQDALSEAEVGAPVPLLRARVAEGEAAAAAVAGVEGEEGVVGEMIAAGVRAGGVLVLLLDGV